MGVYIKGMKMPKDCRECPMQTYSVETGKTWCLPADEFLADNYRSIQFHVRPEWCPLVEVPTPHGRLIDADALADDLEYDALHFEEEHELKSNCASWLRSNDNITVIEAEDEG